MNDVKRDRAKKIAFRLKQEMERVDAGPTAVAKHLGVARNTVYSWVEKGGIPADRLVELVGLDMDATYILTGYRSSGPESLTPDEKMRLYQQATKLVAPNIARQRLQLEDWQVTALIDYAYKYQLDEDRVRNLLALFKNEGRK